MASKFPKETGGGWYELSDGTKVQGEDQANEQEKALSGGSGNSGSDNPKLAPSDVGEKNSSTTDKDAVGDGTGLESLAVDRESEGKNTGERRTTAKVGNVDVPLPEFNEGDVIGEVEADPRAGTPVDGKTVIGVADSGEPIVAGGVETMTSGVPADAAGTNDPTLGVAQSTDVALARHEEAQDDWGVLDPEKSDGSPADRIKVERGGNGNPDTDPNQTVENERNQPDA